MTSISAVYVFDDSNGDLLSQQNASDYNTDPLHVNYGYAEGEITIPDTLTPELYDVILNDFRDATGRDVIGVKQVVYEGSIVYEPIFGDVKIYIVHDKLMNKISELGMSLAIKTIGKRNLSKRISKKSYYGYYL